MDHTSNGLRWVCRQRNKDFQKLFKQAQSTVLELYKDLQKLMDKFNDVEDIFNNSSASCLPNVAITEEQSLDDPNSGWRLQLQVSSHYRDFRSRSTTSLMAILSFLKPSFGYGSAGSSETMILAEVENLDIPKWAVNVFKFNYEQPRENGLFKISVPKTSAKRLLFEDFWPRGALLHALNYIFNYVHWLHRLANDIYLCIHSSTASWLIGVDEQHQH
uniref:Uncharacterized protein n=1 Tax=Glossina pallidipes TaxID=7398 RepID=A0A1B0A0J4_GLOPL